VFEKEEEKLRDYKTSYDQIDIPENRLDEAILAGFQKAKLENKQKPRKKKWLFSIAAAAIVFISFFTSIRLSPAFADYIAVIPGMEKLVEIIRNDKGKLLSIENDYYEELGISQEKNGLTFTLDGVIADEDALVLFYSLQSEQKQSEMVVEEVRLKATDVEDIKIGSFSYGRPLSSEDGKSFGNDMMEYHFQAPLTAREFELKVKVKGDHQTEEYTLPFQLKKEIKKKKTYVLNKSVTIEGQKITFVDAKVYPLRVAVHVKLDPNNTKKLLNFDDLRLVDENGEVWNKIADGVTASHISENEKILYLQSNYFRDPEELYLVLNKIQAVDREKASIIVDIQAEKILSQPEGNLFSDVVVDGKYIMLKMRTDEEFHYHPFSDVRDKDGNLLDSPETSISGPYDGMIEFGVNIPELQAEMNPISLELSFFPAWIEGNGKVKIK
jgi:hypothetical protein